MTPVITVSNSSARSAAQCWRMMFAKFISAHPGDKLHDQIDQLDADERGDDAAQSVEIKVAAQQLRRAAGRVLNAPERQRDQYHDDDRVEDHCGKNRRLR